MSNITVVKDSYTDCIRMGDPDDRYSGEDHSTHHDIKGFKITGKNDCIDGAINFTPKKGVRYYLVHAIYTTGDSYSTDEGQIEFIGLYESKEFAQNIKDKIDEHNKLLDEADDTIPLELVTEDGKEYQFDVPWQGYFETLSDVEVSTVKLTA